MLRKVSVCILFVGLVACSSGEHMATAEQGVAAFRQLMNAQRFDQVYANGSDELRKSTSQAEMTKILAALNSKLGKVQSAERNGWNVNFHTSGTFVTLGFKTQFEKGPGVEQFVFRISDDKASLVSYNVNSIALLTN